MTTMLKGMQIDEVSLVRRPANQHAAIVFSKSDEGVDMPGTIMTDTGEEVAIDDLEVGTIVEGEDGTEYEVVALDEEGATAEAAVEEQAGEVDEVDEVGKSDDTDYVDLISKAYASAVTEEERAEVIKGLARDTAKAAAAADQSASEISKMQEQAYLSDCISKAEDYGFAGPRTEEFGVAISKMLMVLTPDEVELMDDIFKSFSELATEVAKGSEAYGESDVLESVHQQAEEIVKSSEGSLTAEQAEAAFFTANPDLYSTYLSEKGSN
jgi:hypothetical protein